MTTRSRNVLGAVLVSALLALSSACELGDDDEMVAPSRTVTASPSPQAAVVPASVPVGRGVVGPGDVVWGQGNTLHVGRRSVDLSPVGIEAFVSTPGGVYVVHRGELWFTDLSRLRGTGITGVRSLGVTADATRIRLTVTGSGKATAHAFDTRDGRAVPAEDVVAVTAAERLRGPDRRGVPVPAGFRLAGWAGPDTFYGVAGPDGRPSTVVSCELSRRACSRLGAVDATHPVRFGTGTGP